MIMEKKKIKVDEMNGLKRSKLRKKNHLIQK